MVAAMWPDGKLEVGSGHEQHERGDAGQPAEHADATQRGNDLRYGHGQGMVGDGAVEIGCYAVVDRFQRHPLHAYGDEQDAEEQGRGAKSGHSRQPGRPELMPPIWTHSRALRAHRASS
jgi:hypothetical protein